MRHHAKNSEHCDYSKIKVILFETVHTALAHNVNKKFDDVTNTWMETKDAIENLRIATKELLRVRGETAKRIDERDLWKQVS